MAKSGKTVAVQIDAQCTLNFKKAAFLHGVKSRAPTGTAWRAYYYHHMAVNCNGLTAVWQ